MLKLAFLAVLAPLALAGCNTTGSNGLNTLVNYTTDAENAAKKVFPVACSVVAQSSVIYTGILAYDAAETERTKKEVKTFSDTDKTNIDFTFSTFNGFCINPPFTVQSALAEIVRLYPAIKARIQASTAKKVPVMPVAVTSAVPKGA
jgi:hypothetical protein